MYKTNLVYIPNMSRSSVMKGSRMKGRGIANRKRQGRTN